MRDGAANVRRRRAPLIVDNERHHTEALTPGLHDLLSGARLRAKDIDRVVVDRGPGLFTGLRVGVATAVGLALGANAEFVGVTSLEVLARGAYTAGRARHGGVRRRCPSR